MNTPSLFMLWSVPRGRSTPFFRMMVERDEFLCLHEPFCELLDTGSVTLPDPSGAERHFSNLRTAVDHVIALSHTQKVFVKETTEYDYSDMFSSELFGSDAHSAILVRHPDAVVPSHLRKFPEANADQMGYAHLLKIACFLHGAGRPLCMISSDDLVGAPEATIRSYCDSAGLEFRPETLRWSPGHRTEWSRTERWHAELANTSGFMANMPSVPPLPAELASVAERIVQTVMDDFLALKALADR